MQLSKLYRSSEHYYYYMVIANNRRIDARTIEIHHSDNHQITFVLPHSTTIKIYCLYFLSILGELKGHVIEKSTVTSIVECGLKCVWLQPDCKSLNYITTDRGQSAICEINNSSKSHADKEDFVRQPNSKYLEPITDERQDASQVMIVI